jgi:RimJ/RimL family protein N-acetyltransferase
MTVWTQQTILRRASAADIPDIMEIERQPGYERLVGRWDEAQHLHNISMPGFLYFVHDDDDGRPIAFAALSGLGHPSGDVLINRMIVRKPGIGTGKIFLLTIMRLAFEGAPTLRLWLRVLPDNLRARHVYKTAGFRDEKMLPGGGMLPDGKQVDLMLMSIDWEDWVARNPD